MKNNIKDRPSLRKAIDAKCKDCIYDPYDKGNWRDQGYACTSGNCPLFDVRPVPGGKSARNNFNTGKTGIIPPKEAQHDR